ncbi:MAG: 16S rRNA (cytosine(967)-C(5))-methyltransferase RsmB [bacterium]
MPRAPKTQHRRIQNQAHQSWEHQSREHENREHQSRTVHKDHLYARPRSSTRRMSPGLASARDLAVTVLVRVDEASAYSDILLSEALKSSSLSAQDRRLTTTIVFGVLRSRNQLDWWIEQVARRPVAEMPSWLKAILRSGTYQLLFLDRVPARAAIFESVNQAHTYSHRGTAGFVNAVLRQIHRQRTAIRLPDEGKDPVASLSLTFSHPEWMVRRWIEQFGIEECKALLKANNQQPGLTIRLNTVKMSLDRVQDSLNRELEGLSPSGTVPEGFFVEGPRPLIAASAYSEGLFEIQGLSSMLAGRVLAPRPGERILDACAGRGGKTTHLAQLMENQGILLGLDLSFRKLQLLEENARRLDVRIIRKVCGSALTSPFRSRFDRVLIDVPCSSLGIIRRHPEIRWTRLESDLTGLSSLQQGILEHCSSLVMKNGILVYSACSFEPEETGMIVDRFLDHNPDFVRDDICLPASLRPSVGEDGYVRIYPHRHDMDGFFIARLKRRQV